METITPKNLVMGIMIDTTLRSMLTSFEGFPLFHCWMDDVNKAFRTAMRDKVHLDTGIITSALDWRRFYGMTYHKAADEADIQIHVMVCVKTLDALKLCKPGKFNVTDYHFAQSLSAEMAYLVPMVRMDCLHGNLWRRASLPPK